ncbi:MAG TPA: ABC transporter permease [Gemmatimonadaceae bacterium]|nr:ABC transporter permease [Gemmatimonadaceae bacterium]
MDTLVQDLRYSARKLWHAPGFTVVVVATLAIAIGATTAVFSIVDAVLLKPLPFMAPDQLVRVQSVSATTGKPTSMSAPDFLDYKNQSRAVADMAAMDRETMNLTADGAQPLRLAGVRVGATFFTVLGVKAQLGHVFSLGDDKPSAPKTAVISNGLWRQRFGSDSAVVGRTLLLGGKPYLVVGVAPPEMRYPGNPDIWVPLQFTNDETDPGNRGAHFLSAIGRLAPGATVEQATHELAMIGARLQAQYPNTDASFGAGAFPLQDLMVQDSRRALLTMMGAVGFVLLIACANVANLLLVRASTRETEMAVRTALGAGRGRIVRQLMTESVLLAVVGAALGAALATWLVDAVVAFGPAGLPRIDEIRVDTSVLLFAAGIGLVAGIAFGLAPALHAATAPVGEMLKAGGRGSSGGGVARRTRDGLVVVEMALAVVLLVGAGLLIRSFSRLLGVDLGFRPDHLVAADVDLPGAKYKTDHADGTFGMQLVERVKAIPGVRDAAITLERPLEANHMRITFEVGGWPESQPGARRVAEVRPVSASYFQTLGIPIQRGRSFTDEDRADAPQVVIVSAELARRYFKDQDPMGKRIVLGWGRDPKEWGADSTVGGTVVGVAGDVKQFGPDEETADLIYLPFAQAPVDQISVVAQTSADPSQLFAALRTTVRELDPDLPMYNLETMNQAASDSVAQPRFYALLLVAFSGVALFLAALGIYGVISYGVSQRTRELGIRIALGATHDRVVRLIITQGLTLAIGGIAAGLVAAMGLTRLMTSLLFGVEPGDPVTFAIASITLLGVAVVASAIPAARASRLDPVVAMRSD